MSVSSEIIVATNDMRKPVAEETAEIKELLRPSGVEARGGHPPRCTARPNAPAECSHTSKLPIKNYSHIKSLSYK